MYIRTCTMHIYIYTPHIYIHSYIHSFIHSFHRSRGLSELQLDVEKVVTYSIYKNMLNIHYYYNISTVKMSYTILWIIFKHKVIISRMKGVCV
jgi:hypothetical protein